MPRRLQLFFLLWLSGFDPSASGAVDHLCRFSAGDQVTISGIATDQSGNSYVCGYAARTLSFPETIRIGASNATEGQGDAFLIKLGVDGARLATVVFGGEGWDVAQKIAVDPSGNVIVLGYTTSSSFPVLNALQSSLSGSSDIFLTKFDSTGTNLIFSTYLGGRSYESPSALGTDGQGEILVAGSTGSDDFLAAPDPFPWRVIASVAFLARLSSDGSQLRFAHRFGGSGYDAITGMTVDQEGHAFLTGNTYSEDLPTLNALQPTPHASGNSSPFVTKIAPDGTTVFSTFLRGDFVDDAQAITVNTAGEIFVGGSTQSGMFPVYGSESTTISTNTVSRLFLVKLSGSGTTMQATNFFRFSSSDRLVALATAPDDRVVAAGTIYGHIGVPFFALLDANGLSSTVTAGRSGCEPAAGTDAMAFDAFGNLIVAGRKLGTAYPAIDSYVARYGTNDWQQSAPPQVTVLSPLSGMTFAAHQPYFIEAAVTGGTSVVTSVKFYNGRRLIGTATNAPFGVTWKNPIRGRHRLTAVANIDGRAVTSCAVNVTVASPRNDAFPGRVLLKSESVEVTGDTTAATGEGLEPWTPTVWYSWRAPRDGLYHLAVSNPNQPFYTLHKVTVFTGSRLKNLAMVGGNYTPSVAIRVRRGEVFRIRVSGYSSSDGEFELRIRRMIPPANDDFANATVLAGESLSTPVTLRDAVSEPGEYYWQFDRHYTGEPTVWFAWTAPRSGLFLASVTGPGYVPALYCFTGITVSNINGVGQSISGETNGTAFYAEEGTRYHLRLSGENTNDLMLHIAPHAPPLNDNFADRFVIPSGFNAATGTMIGATGEPGEPGGFFPSVTSVWWTWTAPTSGVYRVSADTLLPNITVPGGNIPAPAGAYSGQVVRVFRGDYLSLLIPEASAVAAFPYTRSGFIFQAIEGTSYQIYLQGGGARYALEVLPVPIPANDNFDDAIALSGVPVMTFGTTYAAFYEPGERGRGYPPPGYLNTDSVWYRWVAPSNGIFAFSVDSANFLEIYEGETLYNSSLLAGDDQRHVIQVNGGTEYRLAVISGRRFKLSIQPAQRPANDDFANRQPLSGLSVPIAGDARDASSEPDEPFFYPSFTPARRSLWYSWTAPTNGTFRLVSLDSFNLPRLSVFTGEVLADLTRVVSGGSYSGVEFAATNGETYQISVDPPSYSPQFTLELRYLTPPRNDNFANRLRLTGTQVSLMASNTGASMEIGEPLNAPNAAGRSVWWTWRAPRTGRVLFDVAYAGKTLGVYTGSSLAGLTPLMNSRWSESMYNLPVRAGTDYHISVDDYSWYGSGEFQLRLNYTTSPSNDSFAKRRSFADQVTGDLEGGSFETGEPDVDSYADSSVWWTWTAPSNGTCRFQLNYASYHLDLALFTGDAPDQLELLPGDFPCTGSCAFIKVSAGSNYLLRVVGPALSSPYTLTATFMAPPANDDFAHRITLPGAPFSVTGSNHTATAEPDEPAHHTSAAYRSVWWSWTAPASGAVRIILVPYSEMRVAVYTGDSLATLQPLTSSFGTASFNAVQGTTYQVAIDTTWWNTEGHEEFTWSLGFEEPAPAPSNTSGGLVVQRPALPPLPPVIQWSTRTIAATDATTTVRQIIETSTDLVDWVPYTNAPANPAELRILPSTNEPHRFFRVR